MQVDIFNEFFYFIDFYCVIDVVLVFEDDEKFCQDIFDECLCVKGQCYVNNFGGGEDGGDFEVDGIEF